MGILNFLHRQGLLTAYWTTYSTLPGAVDELLYRFRVGLRRFYGESWTLDVERAANRIALVITMPSVLARDQALPTDTFPPSQPETSHA